MGVMKLFFPKSWGRSKPNTRGRSRLITATMVILTVFGMGCTSRTVKDMPVPPPSVSEARFMIQAHYKQVERYESRFSISFQAGVFGGGLFGSCYLESPDKLSIDLNGPFNMAAGSLVLNEGEFEILVGSGEIYSGNLDTLDLEKLTGIPLPTEDPFVIFSPVAIPGDNDSKVLNFNVLGSDSLWVLDVFDDMQLHQYVIQPRQRRVVRESWSTPGGVLLLEKKYHDFTVEDGVYIPKSITLQSPGIIPMEVEIKVESCKVNPTWRDNPFTFKRPNS